MITESLAMMIFFSSTLPPCLYQRGHPPSRIEREYRRISTQGRQDRRARRLSDRKEEKALAERHAAGLPWTDPHARSKRTWRCSTLSRET